jgi:hypothetical protein
VRWGFDLWAYVFMTEPAHLILRPRGPEATVATILKAIKQPVGRRAIFHLESHAPGWLPRIPRKRGGEIERLFWQSGGGYDRNLVEPQVLWAAMDYLHLNPGDRSSRADASGVEPRRVGMVCWEVRVTGRGTSRRGPSGRSDGHPACRPLRSRRFSLDTGMRPVSNACSGQPGEVPDDEVNSHLGNPGLMKKSRS